MAIKNLILFILLLLIKFIIANPSNSYYLIAIDKNLSLNNSYCSNILISKDLYRIPNQCHKHLLCDSYNCDDKSFRCIKIRETLCCLYKYIEKNCQTNFFKEQFRSIYFYISIQHGYCEINLERIEQNDYSYCLTNHFQTTITSFEYFHRSHLTTRSYFQHKTTNISSKSSFIYQSYSKQINTFVFFSNFYLLSLSNYR